MSHEPEKPSGYVAIVLLLAASLVLTVWYAESAFIPNISLASLTIGFDAFRYHVYAIMNASRSPVDILAGSDASPFAQMGYPIFLSLLYSLITPDPLVGALANWLLWAVAGFLLMRLARPEPENSSDVPFMTLWLLYPESITWCGMTCKEPLIVFAIACAVRTCSSRMPRWAQSLVIGALAVVLDGVRAVAVLLVLLALAISFEFRKDGSPSPRTRGPRIALLAIVGAIILYVVGDALGGIETNPLASAGYERTVSSDGSFSTRSLLRQMGSPNRMVDLFYVPVRGAANILCPIYLNPLTFGDIDVVLSWLSAGLCFFAVWAVSLRLLDHEPWTRTRAVLFGVFALGFVALGLSGIIHERYRAIVLAGLLPLGMRSFREEVAAHGPRRLIIGGAVLPVFVFLLYRILRQLS